MFRIHFDPKLGRFIVQVHRFGIFWSSVMALNDDSSGTNQLMFKTLDEASAYVKSIGLDKLYRDGSANMFREYMSGKGYTRMTDGQGRVIDYQEVGARNYAPQA
jgi:hypothetical protein